MLFRTLRLRVRALPPHLRPPLRRRQSAAVDAAGPETPPRAGLPAFDAPSAQPAEPAQTTASREVPLNDANHPVAQDYAFFQHQRRLTQHVGTAIAPHYRPHELLTRPPRPSDVTLELLVASQTHIGHSTSLWNPANSRYIFGIRGEHDPIHIIAPDVTAAHLRRACKVVSEVAERGGVILFVGTREGQARAVVKAAELSKGCHLFTKWIPGTITNGQQILGRAEKKVVDEKDEEVAGFEDQLPAKAAIKPDLVVCLNPLENYVLLHECGLNNIPTIGIIDTDANPTWVTYPIPANDDSLRAVQLIAAVLGRAGQSGQEKRLRGARETGFVVYPPIHGLSPPQNRRGQQPDPRRPRQPRRRVARPAAPAAEHSFAAPASRDSSDADGAATFPADHENPDLHPSEEDQALLAAAESTLSATHPDFPTGHDPPASARAGAQATTTAGVPPDDEETLDPSLTDDHHAAAPEPLDEAALAQFGIHSDPTAAFAFASPHPRQHHHRPLPLDGAGSPDVTTTTTTTTTDGDRGASPPDGDGDADADAGADADAAAAARDPKT